MANVTISVEPMDIYRALILIRSGNPKCTSCPVAIAATRALKDKAKRVLVGQTFIAFKSGTRQYLADLPPEAVRRIAEYDATGRMKPFDFEVFVRNELDPDPGAPLPGEEDYITWSTRFAIGKAEMNGEEKPGRETSESELQERLAAYACSHSPGAGRKSPTLVVTPHSLPSEEAYACSHPLDWE